MEEQTGRTAIILGVTGIVGRNLACYLVSKEQSDKWRRVYGVSRNKPVNNNYLPDSITHIPCDLLDLADCQKKLGALPSITHIFYATWQKRDTEEENIEVNVVLMKNLLATIDMTSLSHFCLVTGTKHYMGPHSAFALGKMITPFRETLPRLSLPNFYYALEDLVFEAASQGRFKWHVARPHTILGFSIFKEMNFGTTIAAYATLCKHLHLPFIFPGSKEGYSILLDATDVRLLARHLIWEVSSSEASNQAFNVVNGDLFRWEQLWPCLGAYFGLEALGPGDQPLCLREKMKGMEGKWLEIVSEHRLKPTSLADLATWWLVDASLTRKVDCVTDMTKSREFGFHDYQSTEKSYRDLFDYLREQKYIP